MLLTKHHRIGIVNSINLAERRKNVAAIAKDQASASDDFLAAHAQPHPSNVSATSSIDRQTLTLWPSTISHSWQSF